jgi:hypothetical protein
MTRFQNLLLILLIGIAGTLTVTVENFGLKASPASTVKVTSASSRIACMCDGRQVYYLL